MGDPRVFARKYYEEGADELIYMDTVASLYGRNNLADIVRHTAQDVFIPMTVGGGVRSVDDATSLLRAGADKIAVNTAATECPALISEIAKRFGSQCMVLSIEAKRSSAGKWEALVNNGRDHTGLDAAAWAREGEKLGAGEILLTSVDREGTQKGFDVELVRAVATAVRIPVIASGGMGNVEHFVDVVRDGHADAVAMAHVLHYAKAPLAVVRERALREGFVRRVFEPAGAAR